VTSTPSGETETFEGRKVVRIEYCDTCKSYAVNEFQFELASFAMDQIKDGLRS